MPATIAHAVFAKDVYDILPEDISKKLDTNKCKMYGQSIDALKFYKMFSPFSGKRMRKFQEYFHKTQSQEFFINLLQFMKDNRVNDKDTCSFLVGFICHYALDSTMHPYIIYKTGIFDKDIPETYKYNNVHAFMETFIDNDIVRRRYKTNPYKFNLSKYCFDIEHFSDNLNKAIDYSFYNTFKIRDMSKVYYKALKHMKCALYVFRKDPYGIKKFFYKLIDTFTSKKCFRFEAISYHYPLEDKHDYLNSNHKLWRNPTTYDMTSNESFVDLYLKSIKLAKVLTCASFDYISGKDIDLEKIFDNSSYVTGIDCNSPKELRFFEF